jgi:hypothetical protein
MRMTIRDVGYSPGQLEPGQGNSILDVKGKCRFASVLRALSPL